VVSKFHKNRKQEADVYHSVSALRGCLETSGILAVTNIMLFMEWWRSGFYIV